MPHIISNADPIIKQLKKLNTLDLLVLKFNSIDGDIAEILKIYEFLDSNNNFLKIAFVDSVCAGPPVILLLSCREIAINESSEIKLLTKNEKLEVGVG